jgi:hypothetical protein
VGEIPSFLTVVATALTAEGPSGGSDEPTADEAEAWAWLMGMFRALDRARGQTSFIDTQPTMILSPSQDSKVTPSQLEIGAGLGDALLPSEKENYPPNGWKPPVPVPLSRPLQPPLAVPQLETLPAPVRLGLGDGEARLDGSRELPVEPPPNPAGESQQAGFWQRWRFQHRLKSVVWMGQLAAVLAGFGCWLQGGRRDKNAFPARSLRGDS